MTADIVEIKIAKQCEKFVQAFDNKRMFVQFSVKHNCVHAASGCPKAYTGSK